MRFQLPTARGMARPRFIPLFAERPSHPSVPLGDARPSRADAVKGGLWPALAPCP